MFDTLWQQLLNTQYGKEPAGQLVNSLCTVCPLLSYTVQLTTGQQRLHSMAANWARSTAYRMCRFQTTTTA
jgi:hypothetical protein